MKQLPETWQDLLLQASQFRPGEEVLGMLYVQLEKDFDRSGIRLPFDNSEPIANWLPLLERLLVSTDSRLLQQLYYFIDLPESIVLPISVADNRWQLLSESILRRELVKIYFKLNYSGGS
jgi:hypothetical protein